MRQRWWSAIWPTSTWEGLQGSEVLPSLQFHSPELSMRQLGFRCQGGTCFPGLGDQKDMKFSCLLVPLQFIFLFAKFLSCNYQFIPLTWMQWGHQVSDLWSLLSGVAVCLAVMLEAGFIIWGTPVNAGQSFWGARGERNCSLAHRPLPVCTWFHKVTVPLEMCL